MMGDRAWFVFTAPVHPKGQGYAGQPGSGKTKSEKHFFMDLVKMSLYSVAPPGTQGHCPNH